MNKILLELDLDKWQKVKEYGHCLCNIKRKCPCEEFEKQKCQCGVFLFKKEKNDKKILRDDIDTVVRSNLPHHWNSEDEDDIMYILKDNDVKILIDSLINYFYSHHNNARRNTIT